MNIQKFLPLIGVLLFAYIIFKIDVPVVFGILKKINIPLLLLAILVYALYNLARIFKWKYLMKREDIIYSFKDTSLIFFIGQYMGIVTPGRIGDFVKALYLKKDGHSIKKSFITVFLDRLSDLVFLFLASYFCMFVFSKFFAKQIYWLSILIIAALVIGAVLLINKKASKRFIEVVFNSFIPKKYKKKFKFSFSEFFKDIKSINKKTLLTVFLMTFLGWFILFVNIKILALALGISVPFLYLAACMCISTFLGLIPISISGIGTRDAVFIALFSLIGLTKESAISLSLMVLFFMAGFSAFVGLLCWIKKPLRIK